MTSKLFTSTDHGWQLHLRSCCDFLADEDNRGTQTVRKEMRVNYRPNEVIGERGPSNSGGHRVRMADSRLAFKALALS